MNKETLPQKLKRTIIDKLYNTGTGRRLILEFGSRTPDPYTEDISYFLAEGTIEQMVREGRTPLMIGRMGTYKPGDEPVVMKPYYQVPPEGYDPDELIDLFISQGIYFFVFSDGTVRTGSTFTLTEAQSRLVEERINKAKQSLVNS